MRALPLAAAALALLSACTRSATEPAEPAAAPGPGAAADVAPLVLRGPDGQVFLRITRREPGAYRLEDAAGTKLGKITVEADRVKVKDAADALRAKVKKKDDGFKLYAADDAVVLKGKLAGGDGLKVKRDDDTELGRFQGAAGFAGGAEVAARPAAGGVEVSVGGQVRLTVEGPVAAEPAALLGLPGLDLYQQAALLIFVREVW
jgi:hypothetical protein